jgi:kynurenine formamidase
MTSELPSYDKLVGAEGLPAGSAWAIWDDPGVGALSLMTRERVLAAARDAIRLGQVISLDLPADEIDPPLFDREPTVHRLLSYPNHAMDDLIESWNTQAGAQWDGFKHQRHPEYGYLGGIPPQEHGVDKWARHGVAGRAVLIDVPRWRASAGLAPVDCASRVEVGVEELQSCLATQAIEVRAGDVLLVRTGWLEWYRSVSPEQRRRVAAKATYCGPGLSAGHEMAAYLWDLHIAAVASDSPTLEAWPRAADQFLHNHLLNLLGIPIGELWDLDRLAADSAADGNWDCFLTSAPLAFPGAAASPANAVAIR